MKAMSQIVENLNHAGFHIHTHPGGIIFVHWAEIFMRLINERKRNAPRIPEHDL